MSLSPPRTVKHTGQESGGELYEIFKFWSFLHAVKICKQCPQTSANCFSFWATLSPKRTLSSRPPIPGFRPRTPLGTSVPHFRPQTPWATTFPQMKIAGGATGPCKLLFWKSKCNHCYGRYTVRWLTFSPQLPDCRHINLFWQALSNSLGAACPLMCYWDACVNLAGLSCRYVASALNNSIFVVTFLMNWLLGRFTHNCRV